jgi:hypothetical protein
VQHAKDARRVVLVELGGEGSYTSSRHVDKEDVNGLWREGSSLTKTVESPRKDKGKEKEKEEWLSLLVREHLGAPLSPSLLSIPPPFILTPTLTRSTTNARYVTVDLKYILRNQRLQVTFEGRTREFCVSKLYASGDQEDDDERQSGDLSASLQNMNLNSDGGSKKEGTGAAMQLCVMNWDMAVEFQKSKVRSFISVVLRAAHLHWTSTDTRLNLSKTIRVPNKCISVRYRTHHLPPSSNPTKH